jgi:hypothetical protein
MSKKTDEEEINDLKLYIDNLRTLYENKFLPIFRGLEESNQKLNDDDLQIDAKPLQDWLKEFFVLKDFSLLIDLGVIGNGKEYFEELFKESINMTNIPEHPIVKGTFDYPSDPTFTVNNLIGSPLCSLNMISFSFCLKQIQLDPDVQEITFSYEDKEFSYEEDKEEEKGGEKKEGRTRLKLNDQTRFVDMLNNIDILKTLHVQVKRRILLADEMFKDVQKKINKKHNNNDMKCCTEYNSEYLTLISEEKQIKLQRISSETFAAPSQ